MGTLSVLFVDSYWTYHCSCKICWHIEHACTFDCVGETGWRPCGGSWWLAKNGKYESDGRAGFWRIRIENSWNLPTLPHTKHVTSCWSWLERCCSCEWCATVTLLVLDLVNCCDCVKSMDCPALNSTTSWADCPRKSILSRFRSAVRHCAFQALLSSSA